MQYENNPQLKLAFDFVQYTNQNIFLTGKAGTGKTTFLKNLCLNSPKRMVVVAPTGVAAINAGGVTVHSFFQLSFGPQIPYNPNQAQAGNQTPFSRFSKEKIRIIKSLDLLIIDEISMVRADVLDGIDGVLRRYRDRRKPFGGVQMLMIGDLQQLAPIVKDQEWELLRQYYKTCFFFSSRALKEAGFVPIELKKIYRQDDEAFIELLNKVRENRVDAATLQQLNSRFQPNFQPSDDEGYITLTTHNYQSQKINDGKLAQITSAASTFDAEVMGEFPEYSYPADEHLTLKVGAQVMFVKNDSSPEKRYYNGKIGTVMELDHDVVTVQCQSDSSPIFVGSEEWSNYKYSINESTQEIQETVIGSFTQIPLKLAWAITIHKSQGLTFEKAIIDARLSFAHGQVYVALSRCKTLDGLVLRTPIAETSVINDNSVQGFTKYAEERQPDENTLSQARIQYEQFLIYELFDFSYLFNQARYILRIWNESNGVILGTLNDQLQIMLQPIQTHLISVAGKFSGQVQQLVHLTSSVENNDQLQVRIKKAVTYFQQKMKEIIVDPYENSSYETDNKATRKTITDAVEKFEREFYVKQQCFAKVANGFAVKAYLETRAKATIEESGTKPRNASGKAMAPVEHPKFYQQLRQWRNNKADELNVAVSRVVSTKSMIEIANLLPAVRDELKNVQGMGGTKLQHFGRDIIEMVIAYRKQEGLEIPLGAEESAKMVSLHTREISYEMFKTGLSIANIAKNRNLAQTTIEGHLGYFVENGELDIYKVVPKEKVAKIEGVINEFPDINGSAEIKEILGGEYTYAEIKMVWAWMKSTKA